MVARPSFMALAADFVCGTIRLITPLRAMVENGMCKGDVGYLFMPDPKLTVAPGSVVLMQRQANLGAANYAQLRSLGCGIAHDIDDLLWAVPPDNPAHGAMTTDAQAVMFAAMREADRVTCSTECLRQELLQLGITATVLPNVLDPHEWLHLRVPRAPRLKARVGWYGQRQVHLSDLAQLNDVVRTLIDEVQWVFFGEFPSALNDLVNRIEFVSQVALPLFPATLAALDLDLMLSPLAQNRFNRSKSHVRLLHAGILSYSVIATDIEAHAGFPVKLVPNEPAAWVSAIRERIADPSAMRREGEALREFVLRNYMVDSWAAAYLNAWSGSATATSGLVDPRVFS
jgi:O-antigen biosynthesis protein